MTSSGGGGPTNGDPINLENMPTRPHRRRREKKLMTMDEVNDRFPLTKYKNWVAARAREGLSTSGGVNAPSSRPGSLRDVDGVVPSSPVDTKHSVNTRPATASSEIEPTPAIITTDRKSMDVKAVEKDNAVTTVEEQNNLEQVKTTASTVDKQPTAVSELDDDDEDDHIHTAVPPELLTNPGDSCAICIDTLEDDDDIRGLTCGHAFHAGCLDPWLTSRRACCPLCKADYYTPKPRPEGEAAEPERSGRSNRRRTEQANMVQQPPSAWTGIRGHPRFGAIGGRFGIMQETTGDQSRNARRARRAQANVQPEVGTGDNATASRRWNPFRRNRPAAATPVEAAPETATPSQLEAGVDVSMVNVFLNLQST
ncbi:putative E3 ubiquitin-protein ligase [Glarea lozoyensis 74030]|uniref:Putative E3 ubiquitin-protein ligase n=1 Tax=Glarea lozoyensis (strain ATCC 74030 / MF5533) TaxID=1104152 RepID=H0EH55_GLAL7|nr:putative E3 ubiquitin-protein ligase [Glarea lozoyensis 74030]